jgi:clan AA aspartic protease
MMTGKVTALREATIPLMVIGPGQHWQAVDAVLDTGFNGFLTLPSHMVRALQLSFVGNRRATLADGSTVVLDLYLATILWHGQEREVLVLQAEGDRSWAWHCYTGVVWFYTLLMMAMCSSSLGPKKYPRFAERHASGAAGSRSEA